MCCCFGVCVCLFQMTLNSRAESIILFSNEMTKLNEEMVGRFQVRLFAIRSRTIAASSQKSQSVAIARRMKKKWHESEGEIRNNVAKFKFSHFLLLYVNALSIFFTSLADVRYSLRNNQQRIPLPTSHELRNIYAKLPPQVSLRSLLLFQFVYLSQTLYLTSQATKYHQIYKCKYKNRFYILSFFLSLPQFQIVRRPGYR